MIESFQFDSGKKGPRVLFFGAIHGNEVCGPKAIARIVKEFKRGKLRLQRGSVEFVPICNPKAYAKNKRYTEENLNRVFKRTKRPRSYEAKLANELCPHIDRCDVFVDLHSMTANGKPFIFLDFPSTKTRSLARALGPKLAIVGWPELYARPDTEIPSYDTTWYAAKRKKVGLLIECGQHEASAAANVAYQAMLRTLKLYGLIAGTAAKRDLTIVRMDRVFFRKSKSQMFAKDWKHLERVRKGQELFTDQNGKPVRAPYDACIVMPREKSSIGEEWLYLAKLTKV